MRAVELRDGTLWFSPSDLSEYLGCAHASAQSRQVAVGARPRAFVASAYADLVFAKGNEHERAYLGSLRAAGWEVVEVERDPDFIRSSTRTAELMRAGVEVIYQGVVTVGSWRGVADFLERVDEPSGLGGWSYEAVDTKLARVEAAPSHVLQLCFYSEGIESVQARPPRLAHLVLGSGRRESIRLREVAAYFRRAREGFERVAATDAPTEPYPCKYCTFCSYRSECGERWRAEDHLSRVAWIRRDQVKAVRATGIGTRSALATIPTGAVVPGVRHEALATLVDQARLQVRADAMAPAIPYELLPLAEGRGFARLPDPSAGDVMFDLEGDPFWEPQRDLTFLFGLLHAESGGWRYEPVWAHSPSEERTAFQRVADVVSDRLARFPDMHVYHYSPAEPGALVRLMAEHATRELAVDDLLRRKVLVDLLAVVRQGLRVGGDSYSLKLIERLAGFTRIAAMGSGSDAVLAYERYRTTGDPGELEGIARYNEEDVQATLALRDWLVSVCPPPSTRLAPVPPRTLEADAVAEATTREALRLELTEGQEPGSVRWLAGELLEYHRREARPGYWRYFQSLDLDVVELLEDAEAIGGLEPDGPPVRVPYNVQRTLRFPAQQHKIDGPSKVIDPATEREVTVASVDDDAGTLVIRGRRFAEDPPHALVPPGPIDTSVQRAALMRVATALRDEKDRYRVLRDILTAAPPRFVDRIRGNRVQTSDLVEQSRLALGLDRSYLLVQGPPGTGKTYTGARLIVELIRAGWRVGVTALSHRAINNLLVEVERAAGESPPLAFRGARKTAKNHPAGCVPEGGQIENVDSNAACLDPVYRLVAGTTWLFASEVFDESLDCLVIDEAGQLSLADALAAVTAAKNVILLGDPLQLPQVSQATHPPGTNASVLEHLLGDRATVPEDRGVFLTQTRRMHPDVCQFISEEVYEGRLSAHPTCALQDTGLGTGIRP